MIDKHLNEREWKAFCKGATYKWEPLHKALLLLEKSGKADDAEALLAAIDEVSKQAEQLRKASKGDKDGKALLGYLAEIDKAAAELRKEARKAGRKQQEEAGEDHEDESGNALLLPAATLKQLVMCRRDPERVVHFGFVNARDKAEARFVLSPKVSGRKLFALLQAESGVKQGAHGDAWIADNELILRPDKPVSGLVKSLRRVLKHVGFRVRKITLWNEDGTVMEQDDAGDTDAAEDAGGAHAAVEPGEIGAAAASPQAPGAPSPDSPSRQMLARLKVVLDKLATLGDHERVDQVKALARDAGAAARLGHWDDALDLVAAAERLCSADPAGAASRAAASPAIIDFTRCIAEWEAARRSAQQDLGILKNAILEHYRLSPDRAEVVAKVPQLDHVLDGPYATLSQLLAKASELAASGSDLGKLRTSLGKFCTDLQTRTRSDRLLSALSRNPFQPLATQRTLLDALGALNESFDPNR